MRLSISYLNYSIVLFILFLIFSLVVSLGFLEAADIQMTSFLQAIISRSFDLPFSTFSVIASAEVTSTLLVILLGYFFIRKRPSMFFISGGLFILGSIIETIGKIIIVHPRPSEEYLRGVLHFSLPSNQIEIANYAYPSGHVFRTTFLVLTILLLINRKLNRKFQIYLQIALFLFLGLMMISRVYLGEHWLSDVVGGYLLGSSFALLSIWKSQKTLQSN